MTKNLQYQKIYIAFDLLINSNFQDQRMEAEKQKPGSSLSCFIATVRGFRNSQKHRVTCWVTATLSPFYHAKLPWVWQKWSCRDSGARSNCKQCVKPAHLWLLGQLCRWTKGDTEEASVQTKYCVCQNDPAGTLGVWHNLHQSIESLNWVKAKSWIKRMSLLIIHHSWITLQSVITKTTPPPNPVLLSF